ncbi:unnamed protein product [Closterium sp. NIES-65]|nr:unnamed protein product [Closterium sp. NIES-65]
MGTGRLLPRPLCTPSLSPQPFSAALRLVCRPWAQLLDSGELCRRRRQCGVAEAWVYVRTRDGGYRNYWRAFDTTTRTWHALPPLPPLLLPGESASATENAMQVRGLGSAAVGGKLYVFGGWREGGPALHCTWCYDPCTHRWQRRADMGIARCYMASGTLPRAQVADGEDGTGQGEGGGGGGEGGKCGGGEGMARSCEADMDSAASTPRSRTRSSTTITASDCGDDGVILVAGGMVRPRLHPSELLVATEQYDVQRDEWVALPPMPQPMLFSSGVTLSGRFLVSGNFTDEGQWGAVYSPRARQWQPIVHRSLATSLLSPCAALGDLLFCIKDALQVWNPGRGDWDLVEGEGRIFTDTRFPCWVCCMAFVGRRLFLVHQNSSITAVTLHLHYPSPSATAPAAVPPTGSLPATPTRPGSAISPDALNAGSPPPAAAASGALGVSVAAGVMGAHRTEAGGAVEAEAQARAATAAATFGVVNEGDRRQEDERAVAEREAAAERAMREVAEAVAAAEAVGVPSAVAPAAGHVAGQISHAMAAGAHAWQQGRDTAAEGVGEAVREMGSEARDVLVSPASLGAEEWRRVQRGGEGSTPLAGQASEGARGGGDGWNGGWWGEKPWRSGGSGKGKVQQVEVRVEEVVRVSEGVAADDEQAIDCYVLEA